MTKISWKGDVLLTQTRRESVVARLDPSGAYDLEFMGIGWRSFPVPPGYRLEGPTSVAIQPDGDIIVVALAKGLGGNYDQVYLMRLLSPSTFFFQDGFESGDLSAWN